MACEKNCGCEGETGTGHRDCEDTEDGCHVTSCSGTRPSGSNSCWGADALVDMCGGGSTWWGGCGSPSLHLCYNSCDLHL